MSNRNDDFTFDDSDDFFNDDSDPFGDLDDDSGVTGGLGDSIVEDMPDRSSFDNEPDDRGGGNRTFVVLIGLLVVVFIFGLIAILFIATRDTGPSEFNLQETSIALTNARVVAFLAETQTQDVSNIQLTQTALAASPTPSQTLTPTLTETPIPTEPRPTITPTPTIDGTLTFLQTLVAQQTADAAATLNVTPPTPLPATATETPPPQIIDFGGDLRQRFATEVAFATQVGSGRQSELATQQAFATQGAMDFSGVAADLLATIEADRQGALTAIDDVNLRLNEIALQREELALALTAVSLENSLTVAALQAPFAGATQAAAATQGAAATLVSDLALQFNDPSLALPGGIAAVIANATQAAAATQAFFSEQATAGVDIVAPAIEATQISTGTRAALDVQSTVAAAVSAATLDAFIAPRQFATQAAIATQVAIATRDRLIEIALFQSPTPGPTDVVVIPPTNDALASFNLTATAIAGQFLTATAQVTTPEAVTLTPGPSPTLDTSAPVIAPSPTRLPDTGIFDDVVGGASGGLGGLLLIVVGLVGVLAAARVLRSANRRALDETPPDETK